MSIPVILASTSASRRRMLEAAGVSVTVVAPEVDESRLKRKLRREGFHNGPGMALEIAAAKAVSVSERIPKAVVVGADQVLLLDGRILDKPADAGAASRQLRVLRGRSHTLVTSVVVAEAGRRVWRKSARAELTMRRFSDDFLADYLAREGDEVTTTVGGYKLEGRGGQLFSGVKGDYFGILGLPLLPLLDYLRSRGALPV